MLLGMALVKLGVFSAQLSLRFYVTWRYWLWSGLPVVGLGAYQLIVNDFDAVYMLGGGAEFNNFGSLLVAMDMSEPWSRSTRLGWRPGSCVDLQRSEELHSQTI